jgi:glycosyltransferase involved in cell wall biosynthesis
VKVYHLSSAPFSGGAARAGFRLHEGLLLGEDIESIWLDAGGGAHGPSVLKPLPPTKPSPLLLRLRRKKWAKITQRHFAPTTPPASNPIGWGSIEMLEKLPKPDVWNLHWVSWFLDWENLLPWMAKQSPIVWTLHDLNPLRGIWHYEPQPEEHTPKRLKYEADAIQIKRHALAKIPQDRLAFVGPSSWMVEECRKSSVTRAFRVEHIPYGLDTNLFSPRCNSLLKEVLGLPANKIVLGFVADRLEDPRKGIRQLLGAVENLLTKHPEIHLLIAGSGLGNLGEIPHSSTGPLQNDLLLSHFYSACDFFVCPSLQDNLPNTVLESLACGTPVVAFNTGGLPDMVISGETGFLANMNELNGALSDALDFRKNRPDKFQEMKAFCRAKAVKEYSLEIQAAKYKKLYASMI